MKKLLVMLLLQLPLLAMHYFALNINDVDLEASLDMDMGQFNETVDPDTTFIGFSVLSSSKEHSALDSPAPLSTARFFIQQNIDSAEQFRVGVGFKMTYAAQDTQQFFALPVLLQFGYRVPVDALLIRLSLLGAYSPKVLSLLDAKNYAEYRLIAEISPIDRATIELGLRHIDLNYNQRDIIYNETAYVGLKLAF